MINKYPFDVRESLVALGKRISSSRRARQITQQELADKSGISRQTLIAIEKGSPEVAIGSYISPLWAMNLHEKIFLPEPADEDGSRMMETELPRRVRR